MDSENDTNEKKTDEPGSGSEFGSEVKNIDPEKCFYWVKDRFDIFERQCRRKRGYGHKGQYCKQHGTGGLL